jgi:hypothetical protein
MALKKFCKRKNEDGKIIFFLRVRLKLFSFLFIDATHVSKLDHLFFRRYSLSLSLSAFIPLAGCIFSFFSALFYFSFNTTEDEEKKKTTTMKKKTKKSMCCSLA